MCVSIVLLEQNFCDNQLTERRCIQLMGLAVQGLAEDLMALADGHGRGVAAAESKSPQSTVNPLIIDLCKP